MFYDISLIILKYWGRKIKLDNIYKYIKNESSIISWWLWLTN